MIPLLISPSIAASWLALRPQLEDSRINGLSINMSLNVFASEESIRIYLVQHLSKVIKPRIQLPEIIRTQFVRLGPMGSSLITRNYSLKVPEKSLIRNIQAVRSAGNSSTTPPKWWLLSSRLTCTGLNRSNKWADHYLGSTRCHLQQKIWSRRGNEVSILSYLQVPV